MPSTHFAQAHGDVVRSQFADLAARQRSRPWFTWALALACAAATVLGVAGLPEQRLGIWLAAAASLALSYGRGFAGALAWCCGIASTLGWQVWQSGSLPALSGGDANLLIAIALGCLALAAREHAALRQRRAAVAGELESEHRKCLLDALLASNQDCLVLLDPEARPRAINPSGLALLELQTEAAAALPPWLHWWPLRDRAAAASRLQRALRGEPQHFSADCPTFRGSPRTWDIQLLPVAHPRGGVSSVLSLWRDITPLQRAARDAQASRDAHAALLERIDDAFVALDSHWNLVFANAEAKATLDVGVDMGVCFWDCFPELLGGEFHAHCLDSVNQQESRRFQFFFARHQIWFNVAVFPSTEGVALLIRDVTEQVRSEVKAERHLARLALAQEIAGFGDWEYDVFSGAMELGQSAAQLLRCREESSEGQRRLLSVIEPAHRTNVLGHLLGSISARQPIDIRFPARIEGRQRVFRMRGQFVADEAGQLRHVVGTLHDMTEAADSLDNLNRERAFARGILDALPQRICVVDGELRLVATNRAWDEFAAERSNEPNKLGIGASYRDACENSEEPAAREILQGMRHVLDGQLPSFKSRYLLDSTGDTEYEDWFEASVTPFESTRGRLLVVCHEDVSAQHRAHARAAALEARFRELAECMPDAAFILDPADAQFCYIGPSWRRLPSVLALQQPTGLANLAVALQEEDRAALRDLLQSDGWFESAGQITLNLEGPEVEAIDLRWSPVRGACGRVSRVVGVIADVSERVRYAERLRQIAFEDRLTGLPNGLALVDQLERLTAGTHAEPLELVLIDVHQFKGINDTLGRAVGDEVLRQIAARLLQVGDSRVSLARLDGDEFALLRQDAPEPMSAGIAAQVIDCLRAPFKVGGESLLVSVVLGSARFPDDAHDARELLRCADIALGAAKLRGRGRHLRFADSDVQPSAEQLRLRADLQQALQGEEFSLAFQPKHASSDGRLVGLEALLRWRRSNGDWVSPARFIPLLEESGDIVEVGAWALHGACRQLRRWRDAGLHDLTIAVNVSAKQMVDTRIVTEVKSALSACELPGSALELEITETAFMSDPLLARRCVAELRACGARIALDDFGTGFSSLSYLRQLSPDVLKLDKSFIDEVGIEPAADKVVDGIVQLAHSLGIEVVAEGVETDVQRRRLEGFGCDQLQGYLFSKPMPAKELGLGG